MNYTLMRSCRQLRTIPLRLLPTVGLGHTDRRPRIPCLFVGDHCVAKSIRSSVAQHIRSSFLLRLLAV